MREIKFRAWDKKKKEMVPNNDLNFFLNPHSGEVFRARTSGPDFVDEYHWEADEDPTYDLIVMQFTGLKDKNGKDIYEGDIVAATVVNQHSQQEVEAFRGVVEMKWGQWSFNTADLWRHCHQKRATVIGNIYENPSLLKDTQA